MKTNPTELTDPLVNRPKHYGGDEAMRMAEEAGWAHGGCFFSAGRYLYRIGLKDPSLALQDAQKALWYVRRLQEKGVVFTQEDLSHLYRFWRVGRKNLSAEQLEQVKPAIDEIFKDASEILQHLHPAIRHEIEAMKHRVQGDRALLRARGNDRRWTTVAALLGGLIGGGAGFLYSTGTAGLPIIVAAWCAAFLTGNVLARLQHRRTRRALKEGTDT